MTSPPLSTHSQLLSWTPPIGPARPTKLVADTIAVHKEEKVNSVPRGQRPRIILLQALQDTWNEKLEHLSRHTQMHQHITEDMLGKLINGVKQSAIAVTRKCKECQGARHIDKCTSTSVVGMVKEMLANKLLDGELLLPHSNHADQGVKL